MSLLYLLCLLCFQRVDLEMVQYARPDSDALPLLSIQVLHLAAASFALQLVVVQVQRVRRRTMSLAQEAIQVQTCQQEAA